MGYKPPAKNSGDDASKKVTRRRRTTTTTTTTTTTRPRSCLYNRVTGLFVPLHFRSRERKDHRENFCYRGTDEIL